MKRSELCKKIFEVSHLTGEFKLRSGKVSNEYFDKYQFESDPVLLEAIAEQMKTLIPKETEVLGALEMGGIPLATLLALKTGLPITFVRKKAKDYGTQKFAEGPNIKAKNICLIEDVITTGGQIIESATDLRSIGAIVQNVICVIDRSEGKTEKITATGLSYKALFTMAELKNT
jgi:orotate phosphoribosyltransferase